MFKRNITSTQQIAEDIYHEWFVAGYCHYVREWDHGTPANPDGRYITFTKLRVLLDEEYRIKDTNRARGVQKKLQELGYIDDENHRDKQMRLGYLITPFDDSDDEDESESVIT